MRSAGRCKSRDAAAAAWLERNVPLLDCPDAQIEEVYCVRWWTYRKHVKQTPDGFVVTEFLPAVGWAGKHNTIRCAAGHHFYEGRWLADPRYLDDYARFWFRKGGEPRRYGFWAADALWARHLVDGSGYRATINGYMYGDAGARTTTTRRSAIW